MVMKKLGLVLGLVLACSLIMVGCSTQDDPTDDTDVQDIPTDVQQGDVDNVQQGNVQQGVIQQETLSLLHLLVKVYPKV